MQFDFRHVLKCSILILIMFATTALQLFSQKKWDGGGGDGSWNTPGNWVDDLVPSSEDDVVLDNSIVSNNYAVVLPSGNIVVAIKSLNIIPSASRTIEVVLPANNTAVPAFIAAGSIYGLEIHSGGIFRNSSGASAGTPVDISDSIKVHNGGLYLHNTSRAHATNVTVLSKAPGTERGTFEFDVPGGSGYTISITGRTYGNLTLSASAAGGVKSYTSTGATMVNIKGDFIINAGVNYSLNFSGAFVVHGDFTHKGNSFDISGGVHSNQVSLKGEFYVSGPITETGTGSPLIELNGINNQNVFTIGSLAGSVTVRINNTAGATLLSELVIPFRLELLVGKIKTTSVNVLIIHDNAACIGGSENSFIEGPMRKIGDDDFVFPVGKQGHYSPVSVAGAGGSTSDVFEAEYSLGNPALVFGSAMESPPIVRISTLEYWKMERVTGTSSKKVSLTVGTLSNATSLENLVVSRWDIPGGSWKNEGNTSFSGVSTGTITSREITSFSIFTLGSTVEQENPLPSSSIILKAANHNGITALTWRVEALSNAQVFEVLRSADNIRFVAVQKVPALHGHTEYHYRDRVSDSRIYYYKVRMIEKDGTIHDSSVKPVVYSGSNLQLAVKEPVIRGTSINILVTSSHMTVLSILVISADGKVVRKIAARVNDSSNDLSIDIATLPRGVYYISCYAASLKTNTIKLIKL